jgi:hypothetical protein
MLAPKVPPLSIDCMTCGTTMELITVEPKDHRTLYTYRCPSRHLQEVAMAASTLAEMLPAGHISRSGGLGWAARCVSIPSQSEASTTYCTGSSDAGR